MARKLLSFGKMIFIQGVLYGIASLMDCQGALYSQLRTPRKSTEESLYGDWVKVGNDMRASEARFLQDT